MLITREIQAMLDHYKNDEKARSVKPEQANSVKPDVKIDTPVVIEHQVDNNVQVNVDGPVPDTLMAESHSDIMKRTPDKIILAPGVVIDNGFLGITPGTKEVPVDWSTALADNFGIPGPEIIPNPIATQFVPYNPGPPPSPAQINMGSMLKSNEEKKKVIPEVINKVPPAPPIPAMEPMAPSYDNTEIITKYPYLGEIEKVSLAIQQHIMFMEIQQTIDPTLPSGLLKLMTINNDGSENPFKSGFIDTGHLYDARPKFFPCVGGNAILEDCVCYPIIKGSGVNPNEKVFNSKLFTDFLTGGVDAITEHRMYNQGWMDLNKSVALISMPTRNMNKEVRKKVQDNLMRLLNGEVFKKAYELAPGSRWRFSQFTAADNFYLSSSGVPERFLFAVNEQNLAVEIHIEPGKNVFILRQDGLKIDTDISLSTPVKPQQPARQEKRETTPPAPTQAPAAPTQAPAAPTQAPVAEDKK